MARQKKLIENEEIKPKTEGEKIKFNEILNFKEEEESLEKDEEEVEGVQYDPILDYKRIQDYDSYENFDYVYHMEKLNAKIEEIFKKSRWVIINPNKKIPKDLIPLIFQDLLKELENTEFTMVEKFVGICDFMDINYLKAYESIHIKYKELIVQEIDKKYNILKKRRIRKIF